MRHLFVLLSILIPAACFSATPLEEADSAYKAEDYARAASLYEQVEADHGVSAALLCNLGNAYVKAGDYGHAMLAYNRALKINPSYTEVKDNIKYVSQKVNDGNVSELKGKKVSVLPDEESFLVSVKNRLVRGVTSDTWAVWSVVSFILLIVCCAAYLFTRVVLARKIGFFGGLGALALTAVFISLSFAARDAASDSDRGVIMTYKIALLSEPDPASKPSSGTLVRGTQLSVLEARGQGASKWYKVRLNSDHVGWIREADFALF